MTCIVGYFDAINECSWIGGDSLGSNNSYKDVYVQPKVFKSSILRNILIGATTSFRHIDLMKYSKTLFDEGYISKNTIINHEYMVTSFVPNLVELFNEGITFEKAEEKGANLLVCTNDSVFEICDDYGVRQSVLGFASVGSGFSFTLGSLYTTKDLDIPVPMKIEMALKSAEYLCGSVQRPFTILNTKNEDAIVIT